MCSGVGHPPPQVHLLSVSNHEQATNVRGALVDRGANGGVAGADTRVIQASGRHVDITGIDMQMARTLVVCKRLNNQPGWNTLVGSFLLAQASLQQYVIVMRGRFATQEFLVLDLDIMVRLDINMKE